MQKIEKKVYVKLTEACNMNCKHCYVKSLDRGQRVEILSAKIVADYLRDALSYWKRRAQLLYDQDKNRRDLIFNISFHGGEPFLNNKYFEKTIEIIKLFRPGYYFEKNKRATEYDKYTIKINIDATTNLMSECFNDNNIEAVLSWYKRYFYNVDLGKPFLKVSYDVGQVRFKNKQESDEFIKRLKQVYKADIAVKVNICITKPLIVLAKNNMTALITMLKILSNYGTGEIHFESLTANTTPDKSLVPTNIEIDNFLYKLYIKLYDNDRNIISVIDNYTDLKCALHKEYIGCRNRTCMQNVVTINPDGRLTGCPNTSEVFGSIFKGKPTNVSHYDYNLQAYFQAPLSCSLVRKEQTRNEECLTCELFPYCNGGCFQVAENGGCTFPRKTFDLIKNMEKNAKFIENINNSSHNKQLTPDEILKLKEEEYQYRLSVNQELIKVLDDKIASGSYALEDVFKLLKLVQRPYEIPVKPAKEKVFTDEPLDPESSITKILDLLFVRVYRDNYCGTEDLMLKAYYVHYIYSVRIRHLFNTTLLEAMVLAAYLIKDQKGYAMAKYLKNRDLLIDYYELTEKRLLKHVVKNAIKKNVVTSTYFDNEFNIDYIRKNLKIGRFL